MMPPLQGPFPRRHGEMAAQKLSSYWKAALQGMTCWGKRKDGETTAKLAFPLLGVLPNPLLSASAPAQLLLLHSSMNLLQDNFSLKLA